MTGAMGNLAVNTVLAYHEIMPDSTYSYCVPCHALQQQLGLVQIHNSKRENNSPVHVTFDDGELSQHLYALPLLAQYDISATFFVTPGLIGSDTKFLSWNRLKEMQDAGHSIQSHSWSHKFLTLCEGEELRFELRVSKEALEDRLGQPVIALAAPGGRWNRRVVEACAAAGYRRLYVSDPWITKEMSGVHVLGRFMVRRTTTLPDLSRILQRDRRMLSSLRLRSQIKQSLVGLIGDGAYHRLWCRLTGYVEFEEQRQKPHPHEVGKVVGK
jgi:peptidoglycan/xylan/chitin deacetylase (PgdA/CDA1 family)